MNRSSSANTHVMRNEFYLISEVAFDRPSLLSCFQKDEVFLIPFQAKVRELNGPVKALQSKVHLVAHRVGNMGSLFKNFVTIESLCFEDIHFIQLGSFIPALVDCTAVTDTRRFE